MKICLIRHAKTAGNLEKRYIGTTDEPLCDAGIAELRTRSYPDCDVVFSSSLRRCFETAKIIFPDKKIVLHNAFNEINFGDFEGKNFEELEDNFHYQKWLKNGGNIAFPNGEEPADFKKRCVAEFEKIVREYNGFSKLGFILHGGTIMAIMEKFGLPKWNFYDYQVENCGGFLADFDGKNIVGAKKL